MSYTISENNNSYLFAGNTIIYKDIFKKYGGVWTGTLWSFNKNQVDPNILETIKLECQKVVPIMLVETNDCFIIKGNTTPYKDLLKKSGAVWSGTSWQFPKTTQNRTFTREEVEKVFNEIVSFSLPIKANITDNRQEKANIPPQSSVTSSTNVVPVDISKLSYDDLEKEFKKARDYCELLKAEVLRRLSV
jgi:hypothetical protein